MFSTESCTREKKRVAPIPYKISQKHNIGY